MKFRFPGRNIQLETFFEREFEKENFRRERQRAGLLAFIFALGVGGLVLFFNLLDHTIFFYNSFYQTLLTYLILMSLYEALIWFFFKKGMILIPKFPIFAKFGNSTFELTCLTGTLYWISKEFQQPILVMISPPTFIYFFFIILSTLRLNFSVSLWTGTMAGLQFLALSYFLIEKQAVYSENDVYAKSILPYIAKSFILILSGIAAGYVAQQIKRSIQLSIENTEKQNQILRLFGQQVSPEIVQVMLAQSGTLESRHMKVAVIFVDIRDFTKYADKHSAEEVVEYQNAFFGIVVGIVNKHKGVINQFLGDGCMITFGAPVSLENPAENAVKAAIDILDEIRNANENGLIPNTIVNMGIQVGDAVTGNIGSETRQQYNITGNVVIQAARIEQLNKEYHSHILVSQQVVDEITAIPIESKLVGYVHLKGIEEEISLWQLA
ncbi:adenylate cyclase /adenylate/guanylate cyclase [Pseudarcicella hirudinis]|uniref:Adenylate cyclase /adenylate/guanylate cyclase n=1 Tax=Pseudarcicella hirudinis TaxID=1079859 RepID=A0A1I5XF87_9BACT|nr:adenylate/guanylate cyclase domain-containing protein [Pseudarcicella hirudinis]SFQ30574.1 adenylate cyclase /adenylate/guanylate cyclase [Pseudarcicella hirudinis]